MISLRIYFMLCFEGVSLSAECVAHCEGSDSQRSVIVVAETPVVLIPVLSYARFSAFPASRGISFPIAFFFVLVVFGLQRRRRRRGRRRTMTIF